MRRSGVRSSSSPPPDNSAASREDVLVSIILPFGRVMLFFCTASANEITLEPLPFSWWLVRFGPQIAQERNGRQSVQAVLSSAPGGRAYQIHSQRPIRGESAIEFGARHGRPHARAWCGMRKDGASLQAAWQGAAPWFLINQSRTATWSTARKLEHRLLDGFWATDRTHRLLGETMSGQDRATRQTDRRSGGRRACMFPARAR